MKKVITLCFTAFIALSLSNAFANNVGCGFGTVVLEGKKGKVFEVLAVTTNGTSASSTFAITSGTSGYKEGLTVGVNIVEAYVAQNMDNLAKDIGKGNGEYVDTLAHLMKVNNKVEFKKLLKKNFDKIYNSDSIKSKQVVNNIKKISVS